MCVPLPEACASSLLMPAYALVDLCNLLPCDYRGWVAPFRAKSARPSLSQAGAMPPLPPYLSSPVTLVCVPPSARTDFQSLSRYA